MGKIDTSGWKEYRMSDLGFTVCHGSRITKAERVEGDTVFLTAGFENCGVVGTIGNENIDIWEKPITVDMFGNVFYHDETCAGDDNIYAFLNSKLSRTAKLFVASSIASVTQSKYSYQQQFRQGDANKLSVYLPATTDGAPDWAYMESYMANLEAKVVESLTLLQAAKDAEKKKVDTREWGKFHLYDIFSISMGNKFDRSKMCEVDEGINFVGRSALTNGVACAVTSVKDKKGNTVQPYPAGDITIALGGSIGAAFVQDREFYTSQNVCVLHTDDHSITERAKWFVSASITASCGNYEAFTDELNRHIRTDFIIRLPVDKTGQPDWAYMEEYMRKVEEKVENVLNCFE